MSLFEAVVLGIVQGITEFAPVSSSAHLVIIPHLFGWKEPPIFFLVTLHLGTLLAVIGYFAKDFLRLLTGFAKSVARFGTGSDSSAKLAWLIILGTIPAAIAGFFLKDFFEGLFGSPLAVGFLLLATGVVLIVSEKKAKQIRDLEQLNVSDAIAVGIAQAFAIAPGLSRSGLTMSAGLFKGLSRESAARFSFLLSFPIILGAFVRKVAKVNLVTKNLTTVHLIVGFLAAAVSGYLCIKLLLQYVRKRDLSVFAHYCFGLGILTIIFSWLVR